MSAELMRLLENVLRVGIVTEILEDGKNVRVQSGDLETNWLRWKTGRAGDFKIWCPPSPGEQVLLGCIGGNPETAILLGSLYSNDNDAPPNAVQFLHRCNCDSVRSRLNLFPLSAPRRCSSRACYGNLPRTLFFAVLQVTSSTLQGPSTRPGRQSAQWNNV